MATYYARTAGGNWNTASTWSLTSGGGATGSVPTSADDVIFDANSGNVVVDGLSGSPSTARDITCTGYTGTLSSSGANYLDIFGSLLLVAGMTFTWTTNTSARIRFRATSTGKTITTAGKLMGATQFIGVGGGWTLQDSWTRNAAVGANFTLQNGSLNTNGQTLVIGNLTVDGTATRSLTLGASTITCRQINFTSTGLTFNCGTSSITVEVAATCNGAGQTFYNVTVAGNGAVHTFTGANTFNTFTRTNSSSSQNQLFWSANQTIGTLNFTGQSGNRMLMAATSRRTPVTLTVGTVSIDHANLDGIVGAGAGNWNLASNTVGGKNCTNITFTSAQTIYFKHTGSGTNFWNTANVWKTTSGGVTNSRQPLIHDTVIIDANSFSTTGLTLNFGISVYPTIDASAMPTTATFTISQASRFYGDFILASGITMTGAQSMTMCGDSTSYFTSNGATITAFPLVTDVVSGNLVINHAGNITTNALVSGTLELAANLTGTGAMTDTGGSLDINSYTITFTNLTFNASTARTFDLGSGIANFTGTGTLITYTNTTNLSLVFGTSTLRISNTSASTKAMNLLGLTAYNLDILGASGAGTVTMNGNNTFNAVTLAALANVRFTNGTNTTITTPPTWLGTSGNLITVASSSAAANATITVPSGTVSCDYLNLTRITAAGATPFYAGANSVDNGNNTNWNFTAPPAAGGLVKVWNGSAWVEKPVKVWNGSAWVQKPLKFYNGTTFTLS